MRTFDYKTGRTRGVLFGAISLLMIAAGVALIGSFFFAGGLGSTASNGQSPGSFNVPMLDRPSNKPSNGPKDKTLRVTIPAMSRMKDAAVPTAPGAQTKVLDQNKAVHLLGSGFPWQRGSNVYIAGHRLGYPATKSFLAFYDLSNLKDGDKIFVTDADGNRYTYRVFREMTVSPSNLSVTKPVKGKSVLTLQTCTLPDYTQRLIVQAELIKTDRAPAKKPSRTPAP